MAWYAYCIVEQQAFQGIVRARRPVPVENLKGIAEAQTFAYPSGEFSLNRRTFLESVAKLKGKAEMHLKLLIKDGSMREALKEIELPASVGSEYLTKLREKATRQRERHTKARALSVQVHKIFDPLDQDVCCRKIDSGGMLVDIAHLIDHKKVQKYQNRYQMATRHLPGIEVVMSGPWPPYHFISGKRS